MYRKSYLISIAVILFFLVVIESPVEFAIAIDDSDSAEVQKIKSVLTEFEKSFNNQHVDNFIRLFHKNAQIMTGADRRIVSRNKYRNIIQKKWKVFGSISLRKPNIHVIKDKAEVSVRAELSRGIAVKYRFSFIKEDGRWIIMEQAY